MRKLSTIIREAAKNKLPEAMSHVSTEDLKKYLEIASRIISSDAKLVISYLIENDGMTDKSILDIAKHRQKDPKLQEVAAAINKLKKYDRLKEIPNFQSREEFKAILAEECTVDEIILDFDSEAGRNEIAKRYEALVHSIARSYMNKSNLDYDQLVSAGWNGFTEALNKYAQGDRVQVDEKTGRKKWISFGTFAAQQIRFYILEDIKNLSHTVRIATSAQAKERALTGSNIKSNTVSGDAIKNDNSSKGGNNKTYFDTLADEQVATGSAFSSEVEELWTNLVDRIRAKFGPKRSRDVEVFLDSFGLTRDEPMKDKEVAAKYGIAASNVTRIKKDIIEFIRKDRECKDICDELGGYFNESMTRAPYVRMVESRNGTIYNIVES